MSPSLSIKLYLDEMVPIDLAIVLRQYGYDVITVKDTGMLGQGDEEQLSLAASQGRVLLSFNVKHFPKIHETWLKQGKSHTGIVVSPQIPMGRFRFLLTLCLKMLNNVTPEEMANRLCFLQEFR